MKETNVWLSPEELQRMLKGTLQWIDVSSQVSAANMGIRKLDVTLFEKDSAPKPTVHPPYDLPREQDKPSQGLEGKPVIWLLGSVGLLTLSSWFYYVVFAK